MFHIGILFTGFALTAIAGIILVLIIAWFVYLAIKSIITYIFESIFLYNVSKKENYKYPFISYIPIANKYYLGKVADKKAVGIVNIVVKVFVILWWMLFLYTDFYMYVLNPVSSSATETHNTVINPIWGLIVLMLTNFILSTYLSHKIMKKVIGKKAVLFTILNIFTLGISRPIVLFSIRKKV